MARYCGVIGFAITDETVQDVWTESYITRKYYGDLLAAKKRTANGEGLNDNYSLSNRVSIVADPFAEEHLAEMRYAELHGVKWKITEREIAYPRIILSLGGVFNEQEN